MYHEEKLYFVAEVNQTINLFRKTYLNLHEFEIFQNRKPNF